MQRDITIVDHACSVTSQEATTVVQFHRYHLPDSIVFITQVVEARNPVFLNSAALDLLLETLRTVKTLHPFNLLAYAFLPDHFHLMLRPSDGVTFSQIMHSLKPNFTKAYKRSIVIEGPMKFWQKRFWDHVIRDEDDLGRHLDYVHYNAVKHGWVSRPEDWSHSSYGYWKKRGIYEDGWGWIAPPSLSTDLHVAE